MPAIIAWPGGSRLAQTRHADHVDDEMQPRLAGGDVEAVWVGRARRGCRPGPRAADRGQGGGLACTVGSDMAVGKAANEGTEELVERFLAGYAERTRHAYATDLEDFARLRGRARAEAIAELLASPQQGRRLAVDFAVDLRRRGLAPATVRRRLNTLSSLVRLAGELGVVEWSLEVANEEEAAAAARRPSGDAYVLPRHPSEIDRLDIQHYAVRAALEGNYLAPIEEPAAVLDVGCGTGQWAFEICTEFPPAMVVGFDLALGKPEPPTNYRFVRGNVLQGLPFADDSFDFVHQRFLISGVPVKSWAPVAQDLVRVARTGGWVEQVEFPPWFESAGPATARLCELLQRVLRILGLDSTGVVLGALDDHLRRAGLVDVGKREFDLPVGEWGGQVGSLLGTDMRAAFTRMGDVFEARLAFPARECMELVKAMQLELEQHHTRLRVVLAFGRKPG
jgi:SAM-dependent methyltransferase